MAYFTEQNAIRWDAAARRPKSTRLEALRAVGTAVFADTYRADRPASSYYPFPWDSVQPLAHPQLWAPSAPLSYPGSLPVAPLLACPPGLEFPPGLSKDIIKEDAASDGSTA